MLAPHDAFPSRGAPDWHRRQITAHRHLDQDLLIHCHWVTCLVKPDPIQLELRMLNLGSMNVQVEDAYFNVGSDDPILK